MMSTLLEGLGKGHLVGLEEDLGGSGYDVRK